MKMKLFYFSAGLNIALLVLVALFWNSLQAATKTSKFIDQTRVEDTKIFERLLVGRLSKQQATQTLEKYFGKDAPPNQWFAKPDMHGIGAGSFFLVFDENGLLSKVEINYFDGP